MDIADSKFILYGRLENARGGPDDGSTDLVITSVIKSHPMVAGKKMIRIPRFIPIPDGKPSAGVLIFADVWKQKPDVYRGAFCTPAVVDYLKGLLALDTKKRIKVLGYCFAYLEHADKAIAEDAFAEFMTSPDSDIGQAAQSLLGRAELLTSDHSTANDIGRAARSLAADKLRKWLQDERTAPQRLRLYGFLLGNCGSNADAALLRTLVKKHSTSEAPPNLDGVLTGYVLLRPREGWAFVRQLVKEPATLFMLRYAGLRTARFFHNTRPDVIGEKSVLDVLGLLLTQADIADAPINDLRKWRCWSLTERILAIHDQPTFDIPIVKRSILRYALQCPKASAARFVADQRKRDHELVEDAEECLKFEAESSKR
jgi:hypothetical protein